MCVFNQDHRGAYVGRIPIKTHLFPTSTFGNLRRNFTMKPQWMRLLRPSPTSMLARTPLWAESSPVSVVCVCALSGVLFSVVPPCRRARPSLCLCPRTRSSAAAPTGRCGPSAAPTFTSPARCRGRTRSAATSRPSRSPGEEGTRPQSK